MKSSCIGGIGEKKSNGGTQYFQQDRVYTMGDVSLCLPAQLPGGSYNYLEVEKLKQNNPILLGGVGKENEFGTQFRQGNRVYDTKGVAMAITSQPLGNTGGNSYLYLDEKKLDLDIQELGGLEEGSSQRRKVFDENGVSPTLQAAMGSGGGNVPFVINKESVVVQKCGDRDKEGSYSVHDYSNTIPANPMSDRGQMLVEQTCVAMRGRNPENPSDRTPGIELEQRLEINNTGCTNTLTTVQKDNMVLEEQVLAYDEQNQTVRTETFGTLTTDGSSPKHNNRVIKIKQATKQGFIECEVGGVCCLEYPTSTLRRARTIEKGQISPTITTESIPNRIEFGNPDFYNFLYEIDGEIYLIRIRKLIPLECWRLMGFTDEDFKKAEKVNSNTQLYKQAGNSIVCDCLEAIFSQMNIKGVTPWNEKQEFTYQGQ